MELRYHPGDEFVPSFECDSLQALVGVSGQRGRDDSVCFIGFNGKFWPHFIVVLPSVFHGYPPPLLVVRLLVHCARPMSGSQGVRWRTWLLAIPGTLPLVGMGWQWIMMCCTSLIPRPIRHFMRSMLCSVSISWYLYMVACCKTAWCPRLMHFFESLKCCK